MHKNKMIQLTNFAKSPVQIGSKLRESLMSEVTEAPVNQKYVQTKKMIDAIKQVNEGLVKLKKQYLKVTRPEKQKQIYQKVNSNVKKVNELMPKLQKNLKQINQEYEIDKKNGDQSNFIECKKLTQEADSAIRFFKQTQESISEQIKSTIKRQAMIIQGENISEQQLQNLINNPQKGQQMLKMKLLDSPSVQLENSVSDIIDKCNDVLRLQKSMRECMDMMQELAMLVVLQGQKLITIEQAISGAQDHVAKGEIQLDEAKVLHKKSQKKLCCIFMIVIAIVGVIVIPILITQIK